ncbi:MAG: DUF4302 domain-containing protein [Bacteroidales bacterium]|nr:DUF4302 domain-containing protein [Bacteroidales bacterium]
MRKIYLILLAVLGMTVTSCIMEEKELFDKTPAERMEAYLDEYRTLLASAEEGWLLQYFPEENQSYGGYTYVLQFSKDSVTAYFQLDEDIATPVSSLYKMTPDDGPVITFDTYNENIHYFATPDISNYEALHGDYEFRIVGKNPEATEVYMKGKRTNNSYTLVKFSGDPVDYLNTINAVESSMGAPAYRMIMDADTTVCSISGNVFEFEYNVYTPEDTTVVTGTASFCYTPEGADFYAPVEINGTEYTNLVFDAENGTLSTEDGKITIIQVIPPLNELFVLGNWFIKYSTLGSYAQSYFDMVKQGEDAIGEELQFAFIGSMLYPGHFGFQFISSGYGGSLDFMYALEGEDTITLQFSMAAAGDGVWYYNNANFAYALFPFGYSTPRTFKLTADDVKNPTMITMTEIGNEVNTITLFAEQIAYPFDN